MDILVKLALLLMVTKESWANPDAGRGTSPSGSGANLGTLQPLCVLSPLAAVCPSVFNTGQLYPTTPSVVSTQLIQSLAWCRLGVARLQVNRLSGPEGQGWPEPAV